MEFARPLPLTPAGQPHTGPDEVQYRMQEAVDLYDRDAKVRRKDVLIITSHRLALIDGDRKLPVQWHLSQVLSVSAEEGGLFAGSAKVVVRVRPLPIPGRDPSVSVREATLKLSFKSGGRDSVLDDMRKCMERRSWEISIPSPAEKRPRVEAADVVHTPGIGGILKKQEAAQKADAALAVEAFADLSELEKRAKAIVSLAESYAAEIARRRAAEAASDTAISGPSATAAAAGASDLADANAQLSALVSNLGIINPITRATAGTLFNVEVARQLGAFIRPVLERSGGMLSLTDVYCIYNRARATDLISPQDLLQSARLLHTLRPALGLHLRAFPSGLQVLQLDSASDEETARRVADLLNSMSCMSASASASVPRPADWLARDAYVTALDVAAAWRVPLQVASQQLLLAEAAGVVCRDDSVHGLRFYVNRFASPGG